jgi:hypothetical protein
LQAASKEARERGNKAYKDRDFDAALAAYDVSCALYVYDGLETR